jgi:sec-independent protein translocase protein TatC
MPNVAEDHSHEAADPVETARMSFGDHLEELRACLIRALIGVALVSVVILFFGKGVLEVAFWPLYMVQRANGLQPRLQSLSPTDAFSAYFKISLLVGLILSMPWVIHQAWVFVSTGLYPRERQFARKLTMASSGLFLIGVAFLYFIVLPIVLHFFIVFNRSFDFQPGATSPFYRVLLQTDEPKPVQEIPGLSTQIPVISGDAPEGGPNVWVNATTGRLVVRSNDKAWSIPLEPGLVGSGIYSEFAIDSYLHFVLQLCLAFGLAFETPLVVCFLAWTNLVPVETMASARRYVLFGIVFLAAVMTPPDVLSQTLLAVPMYMLFELGIRLARSRSRGPGVETQVS